jgi:hypothetical protein
MDEYARYHTNNGVIPAQAGIHSLYATEAKSGFPLARE